MPVERIGYFTRLKNAFAGIIIGGIMFLGSFYLHWWNEGNAVTQFKTIGDLDQNTVAASPDRVDPDQEGKPVYLAAEATTEETLTDSQFGVSQVALRLQRTAEMYQWDEDEQTKTEKNAGGSETEPRPTATRKSGQEASSVPRISMSGATTTRHRCPSRARPGRRKTSASAPPTNCPNSSSTTW